MVPGQEKQHNPASLRPTGLDKWVVVPWKCHRIRTQENQREMVVNYREVNKIVPSIHAAIHKIAF